MIKFTVPGKPQGKGRPRVTSHGTYTPEATKRYQKLIQGSVDAEGTYYEGVPLKVVMECFYPIPKSMPKYKRDMVINCELYPIVKPDLDNVAKAILDALNGVLYKDDNQVVDMIVTKRYSDNPRVEVSLCQI